MQKWGKSEVAKLEGSNSLSIYSDVLQFFLFGPLLGTHGVTQHFQRKIIIVHAYDQISPRPTPNLSTIGIDPGSTGSISRIPG